MLDFREEAGERNLGPAIEQQAQGAVSRIVLHEQNDGFGKVGVGQALTGYQNPPPGERFGKLEIVRRPKDI
jgi:hypothetical protein